MNVTYNYSGKKVLITGGASGIGLAAARAYADSGADVAVFDKKFEIETK
ncbi:SDR family NAD(P)-dependent oxidoreductase, partial [Paenibacillus sp. MCAF20]